MNTTLSKEHLGKITRFDSLTVITLPDAVFSAGDILVLFNNTDLFTTLHSDVANTYRSTMSKPKKSLEIPPRSLVNIVFVADDTAVVTIGV